MMNKNMPCDPEKLKKYLENGLSRSQSQAIEKHLSTCEKCSRQLEAAVAPAAVWSQTKSMLQADELDGSVTQVDNFQLNDPKATEFERISDALASEAVESAEATLATNPSSMLTREIQGWLDPTDDPKMLGRFAGYEIVGVIGHGGMGIVLKGFEASLNRFVAIKAMAPRLASSGAARKRFAREAQATATVLHDNVVAIYRVDMAHGLPFLVMPYLGGESLQQRIDNEGPLGIEPSLRIASQIAAGLAAAHARGFSVANAEAVPSSEPCDQKVHFARTQQTSKGEHAVLGVVSTRRVEQRNTTLRAVDCCVERLGEGCYFV